MNREAETARTIRDLAENANAIKKCAKEDNLKEAARLVGERVGLIEDLRALKDAKVSIASSDMRDEMNLLVKNIQDDILEAMKTIRERSSALLKELAKMGSAKKIAAYKIQGGHYGY
jgi:Mg2+ and Co2+ transporter CorA